MWPPSSRCPESIVVDGVRQARRSGHRAACRAHGRPRWTPRRYGDLRRPNEASPDPTCDAARPAHRPSRRARRPALRPRLLAREAAAENRSRPACQIRGSYLPAPAARTCPRRSRRPATSSRSTGHRRSRTRSVRREPASAGTTARTSSRRSGRRSWRSRTGTVFSVGWNDLGGYRLWLRDRQGNQFYYAHLSAFSPLAVDGTEVRAGDVIGFVGNTGDAQARRITCTSRSIRSACCRWATTASSTRSRTSARGAGSRTSHSRPAAAGRRRCPPTRPLPWRLRSCWLDGHLDRERPRPGLG